MKQLKIDKEQAKADKKQASDERLQAAYSLQLRLAKFAGVSASARNNYRITSAGTPMGLLVDTATFQQAYQDEKAMRKLLHKLQGGSSSALKSFQKVSYIASALVVFVTKITIYASYLSTCRR